MFRFNDFIPRKDDDKLKNASYKRPKRVAIGAAFAGHISKESTQGALDAFHNVSSGVKKSKTKDIIRAPSTTELSFWFYIKNPTYDECDEFRKKYKFNIYNPDYGVTKTAHIDRKTKMQAYVFDVNMAGAYGITKKTLKESYGLDLDDDIVIYKKQKSTKINYPMRIVEPIKPTPVEIAKFDVIRKFTVEDEREYPNVSSRKVFYFYQDLIACGYITPSTSLLWIIGKPVALHRTVYGDVLEILEYTDSIYYRLMLKFPSTTYKNVVNTYLVLCGNPQVIRESIYNIDMRSITTNYEIYANYQIYRTTLFVIREVTQWPPEFLQMHIIITLNFIANGFRSYTDSSIYFTGKVIPSNSMHINKSSSLKSKSLYNSAYHVDTRSTSNPLNPPNIIINGIEEELELDELILN